MTATSTLLAPLLTPLLVLLLVGETVDVNVVGMLLSILWVVILPIVLGLLVKRLLPKVTEQATVYLPAVSSIAICLIVMIVIAANAYKLLAGGWIVILVVMLHNVLGLAVGYLIGLLLKMTPAKRRAISVEVGCRTAGWPRRWRRSTSQLSPWPPFPVLYSVSGTTSAGPSSPACLPGGECAEDCLFLFR